MQCCGRMSAASSLFKTFLLLLILSSSSSLAPFSKFIGFEELQKSLNSEDPVLLIDVRTHKELNEVGQIPGSVSVPLQELREAWQDLDNSEFMEKYGFERPGPEREDVVLTCRSGRRVLVADRILAEMGYDKLRIYSGSFIDWVRNGGEVIKGQFGDIEAHEMRKN